MVCGHASSPMPCDGTTSTRCHAPALKASRHENCNCCRQGTTYWDWSQTPSSRSPYSSRSKATHRCGDFDIYGPIIPLQDVPDSNRCPLYGMTSYGRQPPTGLSVAPDSKQHGHSDGPSCNSWIGACQKL